MYVAFRRIRRTKIRGSGRIGEGERAFYSGSLRLSISLGETTALRVGHANNVEGKVSRMGKLGWEVIRRHGGADHFHVCLEINWKMGASRGSNYSCRMTREFSISWRMMQIMQRPRSFLAVNVLCSLDYWWSADVIELDRVQRDLLRQQIH